MKIANFIKIQISSVEDFLNLVTSEKNIYIMRLSDFKTIDTSAFSLQDFNSTYLLKVTYDSTIESADKFKLEFTDNFKVNVSIADIESDIKYSLVNNTISNKHSLCFFTIKSIN